MKKSKRLLIIPARGGSKRIKNKNIKKFKSKPIIFYPLENAIKSKLFEKIHVSTESEKIIKISEKKINIDFRRPKKLSGNKTPLYKVFKFVVSEYKKRRMNFDEVWCVMPCTPNITFRDFKKISSFYNSLKIKKPVFAISKYRVPVEWAYKLKKNKLISPVNRKFQLLRSQEILPKYFDSGQIYIFSTKDILKLNFKKNKFERYGFEMSASKSIDIDNYEDWEIAEKMHKK